MHVIGLVAEYNPFHNGHLYQINKIKEIYPDSLIIAVISSYFTERGEISILDKWQKTKIALENGIDIVIELPFVYAVQSSDIFAKGAITILENMQIDTLAFGTESENINIIKKIANLQLNNKEYSSRLKKYLASGLNYPTATNKAIEELTGYKIDTPNDLLALSYIRKIIEDKKNIELLNIQRTTSYHGSDIKDNITSATNIRKKFELGEKVSDFLPYSEKELKRINMSSLFPYLKYKIIIDKDKLNSYQTVDEGLENRILKSVFESNSYEELIKKVKSKRYTYNKISRMFLHILTSFTKEEAQNIAIDYIRILGFTQSGKKYLNKIKKEISLPIITSYKREISKVLDKELQVASIYSLFTDSNLIKKEYQKKPIIKE